MKKRVIVSIVMSAIFIGLILMNSLTVATSQINSGNIEPQTCTVYSDLVIRSKNISSNWFSTVNSYDAANFSINTIYCYECHDVSHPNQYNVKGKVTENTGGCTIITEQFQFTNSASNSTGSFKEYNGYVVMKNIGHSWTGSHTNNYVAVSVNAEVFTNGDIFMQYSIAYSKTPSEEYTALMDITGVIKNICE